MIVAVIVACEVGFWVLLGAGLVVRYAFGLRRTSVVLLASVPVVDLVLLVATVLDLRGGGVATPAHGLAAAYIAFSVVFGHRTIAAVDARVAHRLGRGPRPERAPARGPAAIPVAWAGFGRAVLAWVIAAGLLVSAVVIIGDPDRTAQLTEWVAWLTAGLGAWFLAGPLSAHVLGRRFA